MKNVENLGTLEMNSKMIEEVLKENPQSVADFKAGKNKAMGFLMGKEVNTLLKITEDAQKPFVADLIGQLGVLLLFLSIASLIGIDSSTSNSQMVENQNKTKEI